MTDLRYTLVSDGPSDELLLRHLDWLLGEHLHDTITAQGQWADLRSFHPRPAGLAGRIAVAVDLYPCHLLFVHRDAEGEERSVRCEEIREALRSAGIQPPPAICVVPVRMTEAWLLFSQEAVRRAAGNPNGRRPIPIPHPDAESLPDPKSFLREALRSASELPGRRLKRFDQRIAQSVRRVADYIDDFTPLRRLAAFRALEEDLKDLLREHGWHKT